MENWQANILIIEDDPEAAEELRDCLQGEAIALSFARSKRQFARLVEQHEFQLLVVDIGLPDGSGLDIIREVRKESSVGIIVISGHTQEIDVVTAIEIGADDYLRKPISIHEFRAKVRRMLQRSVGQGYSKNLVRSDNHEYKTFGDWSLDVDNHRLLYQQTQELDLTTAEYRVLLALVSNSNRILSRHALLHHLHGESGAYDERAIDGVVSRLRRKLAHTDNFKPIKTIRNSGYMFSETVRTERHSPESPEDT
ncbi:MAG: response regulator transcription factor [Halioglobus sp.]